MKKYLEEILAEAFKKLNYPEKNIQFDKPKDEKNGDLSSNVAMLLAKDLKSPPGKIAEEIINNLNYDNGLISKIEIAGAGFINFFIADSFYIKELEIILRKKSDYGRSDLNINRTANLEWVSANPTGLLHLGHGRQVALGKTIANLLEWTGYIVTREYYYNDAGNQMNTLGRSVYSRYMQISDPSVPFPEDGYAGQYVKDIAKIIFDECAYEIKMDYT
ncbi:MAG: arginine--tRNA ligase, partial [bacterium]